MKTRRLEAEGKQLVSVLLDDVPTNKWRNTICNACELEPVKTMTGFCKYHVTCADIIWVKPETAVLWRLQK